MLYQDVTIEELLELRQRKVVMLIDVRSPSEFEDTTIPGSVNIPLLNDAERAEVGILYKQVSIQAAKDRGLEIISAKLPAYIKSFEQIEQKKAVFCWRGGMRSKTAATVLSLMGIRVYRLIGGVRAYRKWVVDTLERYQLKQKAIVLNGKTGSGKTQILRELKQRGYPVVDLEALAGHRGSIFGQIGLKAYNQKTFDSLLLERLHEVENFPYVLLEAESKRIGKAVLPEWLTEAKIKGTHLFIEMPFEVRIQHILSEYRPQEHKIECLQAFEKIKKRIHTPIAAKIEAQLQADQYPEAVSLLLQYYYDVRYEYAFQKNLNQPIVLQVNDVEEAVKLVIQHLPKSISK